MSLTNLTNVKQYLGISGSGSDTLLSALILYADSMVKSIVGRNLESASYTERIDGNGREFLRLPNYPVTAVASINCDDGWVFDSANNESTDVFYLDGDAGLVIRISGFWPEGRRNIRVAYTAGYVTLPKDIVHAANIVVADLTRGPNNLRAAARKTS